MAEAAQSLKVFVSYSRADVDFADQLVLALEDKGFQPILDRHDISGAENWRERLGKLILTADAVAFVLTPRSAASDICAWEVEEARRLGKRIVPVTTGPLGEARPPEALGELNWIPFYPDPAIPGSGFYFGVKRLAEALSVDLDWLRGQTRYSERALEWAKARADDLLLRGQALREAEAWLARTPAGSHPPDLVREYLAASGDAEKQREAAARSQLEEREQALKTAEAAMADSRRAQERLRRFSVWALAAGLVLLAFAAPGNYFAATRTLEANDTRAALFADAANQLTRDGDFNTALLLALAGDPPARAGFLESLMRPQGNMPARNALVRAYTSDRQVAAVSTGSAVTAMTELPDGKRFVTFHGDGSTRLWEGGNPTPYLAGRQPFAVDQAIALDRDRILLRRAGEVVVWSVSKGADVGKIELPGERKEYATAIAVDPDARVAAAAFADTLLAWGIDDPSERVTIRHETGLVSHLAVTRNGYEVIAAAEDAIVVWDIDGERLVGPSLTNFNLISSLGLQADGTPGVGFENGTVGAIDTDTARVEGVAPVFVGKLSDDPVGVNQMRFSHEGDLLFVSASDGRGQLLRIPTALEIQVFGNTSDIKFGVPLPAAGMIATASESGVIRMWEIEGLDGRLTKDGGAYQLSADGVVMRESAEGWFGAVSFDASPATVFNLEVGGGRQITVSPDGLTAVVVTPESAEVWRAGARAPERVFQLFPAQAHSGILHVAFLPDGQRFIVVASKGETILPGESELGPLVVDNGAEVTLWSVVQDAPVRPPRDVAPFEHIAVSADGELLATAMRSDIRVQRGDGEAQTFRSSGQVSALAIHPDGQQIAIGQADGKLYLWRVGEAQLAHVFEGHERGITGIDFADGGGLLLSASRDGTVRLWRPGERQALQVFNSVSPRIFDAVLAADEGSVIAMRDDDIVRWTIDPIVRAGVDEQVELACARLRSRGVPDFTDQHRLTFNFLDTVRKSPCETLGVR